MTTKVRCAGYTQDGKGPRCSRMVDPAIGYCFQHTGQKAAPANTVQQVRARSPVRAPQPIAPQPRATSPLRVVPVGPATTGPPAPLGPATTVPLAPARRRQVAPQVVPRGTSPKIAPVIRVGSPSRPASPPKVIPVPRAAPRPASPVRPPREAYTVPYTHEEISRCTVSDEGDLEDPITYQKIEADRLVIVPEGRNVYCFDVETLQRAKRTQGKDINPITTNPLNPYVIERIRRFSETLCTTFRVNREGTKRNLTVNGNDDLGTLILEVIRTYPGGFDKIIDYDIRDANGISLYDDDLLETTVGDKFKGYVCPTDVHVSLALNRKKKEAIRQALLMYTEKKGLDSIRDFLTTGPDQEDRGGIRWNIEDI